MSRFAVIIAAGGSSTRMGGINKLNIVLDGKSVLERSRLAFEGFDQIIVVGDQGDVPGGSTRQQSVYNGLQALDPDIDYVLIHDGARPFVGANVIDNVKQRLLFGACGVVPCVSPKNTIRTIEKTLDRSKLYEVQTPQGFKKDVLIKAYDKAMADGFEGTDDAQVLEHYGEKIEICEGSYENIKITTKSDLPKECRIRFGNGYDLHKLVSGRPLMLGCINIPFDKGLLGHSDADVIAHAIADAMLGAAALGDIGRHFPDKDPKYEGISGSEILRLTDEILQKNGFRVLSVDATLVAQEPKIAPHAEDMQKAIAKALQLEICSISVKATTEEGLGATGRGEAMAAYATAVVEEIK